MASNYPDDDELQKEVIDTVLYHAIIPIQGVIQEAILLEVKQVKPLMRIAIANELKLSNQDKFYEANDLRSSDITWFMQNYNNNRLHYGDIPRGWAIILNEAGIGTFLSQNIEKVINQFRFFESFTDLKSFILQKVSENNFVSNGVACKGKGIVTTALYYTWFCYALFILDPNENKELVTTFTCFKQNEAGQSIVKKEREMWNEYLQIISKLNLEKEG